MNYEKTFQEEVIDRLARIESHVEAIPDHEVRLRSVEKKVWAFSGASALLGTIIGWISNSIH